MTSHLLPRHTKSTFTNSQNEVKSMSRASLLKRTVVSAAILFALMQVAPQPTRAAESSVKPPAAIVNRLPSPFGNAPQVPHTFTGDAAPWAVGIVTFGAEALVYLCDGANPGQWFGAAIKVDTLTGTAPNGSFVKASLKSGAWAGTVTLQGKPVAFATIAATPKNGYGIWRAKPDPQSGPDFVVGWISSAKGVRGISQTLAGKVTNGIVATVSASGQPVLNGAPITMPVNPPGTTIAGQVLSAPAPGATTIPPDTTKLCLLRFAKFELALKRARDAGPGSEADLDAALTALGEAKAALDKCLAG
jgi:hypothetical protein